MSGTDAGIVPVPEHANFDIEVILVFFKDHEILAIKRRAFLWRYAKYKVSPFVPAGNHSGELKLGALEPICACHSDFSGSVLA
jgi:hypothetical protein